MVSKIRELCKKNKTSIAALERQLGFGNGVIGRWDKSVPNYDRLCAVADALGVTVSELTGDEGAKKDPGKEAEELTIDDVKAAIWNTNDPKKLMEFNRIINEKMQEILGR